MRKIFGILGLGLSAALIACGGGGGNPGTLPGGGGSGGGSTPVPTGTLSLQVFVGSSSAPTAVNSMPASENTARVQATLKDATGAAVANEIVTFAEQEPGLLKFSPDSKTALTNSQGVAEIDVSALTTSSLGATRITAAATLATGDVSGGQNISITSAVGGGVDPQTMAQSLNFLSVDPSDKSIVIAGAGGNGRSETAILQFKVVDKNGNPVKDVSVDFSVPPNTVQLNIPQAKSNNDGVVTTSVSSMGTPTVVVISATVHGKNVTSQSDQLTVTNGVATQGGFDLSASKANLNWDVSGDSSTIRIGVVDSNGNPVADGVPVVAVADFGRVGTSSRGGCQTVNGVCTVDYQIQNPRPADGQPITVTVSAQTGNGTVISDRIQFRATSVAWLDLYSGNTAVNAMDLTATVDSACKATWSGTLGTLAGFSAPAGTTIDALSFNSVVAPSVLMGSPVLDRASARTSVTFQFQLNQAKAPGSAQVQFKFTAGSNVSTVTKTVQYPACTPAT